MNHSDMPFLKKKTTKQKKTWKGAWVTHCHSQSCTWLTDIYVTAKQERNKLFWFVPTDVAPFFFFFFQKAFKSCSDQIQLQISSVPCQVLYCTVSPDIFLLVMGWMTVLTALYVCCTHAVANSVFVTFHLSVTTPPSSHTCGELQVPAAVCVNV